ncbi:ATP-binding protein [Sunxiuqinia sp. A32]|uniref:ATP-binding protein n=1 Tax=Sunxiuqinia sp. A32 TaxID=3461496 RepID=UPI00404649AC
MANNPNIKYQIHGLEFDNLFVWISNRFNLLLLLILIPFSSFSQLDSATTLNSTKLSFANDSLSTSDSVLVYQSNDSIQAKKVYKVGLPYIPGLMSKDKLGNINGFALEIFQTIAIDENISYVWVNGSWSELFNKLQNGEIDVLPGTQESEARKELLDFTYNSLYAIWSELYLNNSTIFENISQLNGQKIGLVINDNSAVGFLNYISGFNIEIVPVFYSNHEEALQMLSQGELFGFAGPTPNILSDLPANIKNSGLYFNPTELKFAFPKNKNQELKNKIDLRLGIYKSNSQSVYYQLFEKYNISEISNIDETTSWEMPEWLKLVLMLTFMILILAVLFLITLKKQVNIRTKELDDRQVYLRKAMEIGEMGTWNFNLKTKELFLSDEVYIVTGIEKYHNDLELEELKRFVHPEDLEKFINYLHLIETDKGQDNYCRMINDHGEIVYIKIFGLIQKNKFDFPVNTVGLIQNVTAQLEHEKELVDAKEKAEESEKMKTSFLENMSHEIRTPLNSIIGFSDMLTNEKLSKEKREDFKYIIQKQNELLLTLINDILDFSRIEAGSLEIDPNDVITHEILDDIYENFEALCPPEIEFKKAPMLPEFEHCSFKSDESRIRQILNNLISNAFKYTNEGVIEFGCRPSAIEGYFDLFVKDTGLGIPDDHLELVFDRFSQLDSLNQGSGLGLAISQSLAKMLGSEIKVKSEEGKGSEFYLSFPLVKESSSSK